MTVTFAFVVVLTLFAAWEVGCIIGRHVGRPRKVKPAPRPWGALPVRPQHTPEPFNPDRAEKVTPRAAT